MKQIQILLQLLSAYKSWTKKKVTQTPHKITNNVGAWGEDKQQHFPEADFNNYISYVWHNRFSIIKKISEQILLLQFYTVELSIKLLQQCLVVQWRNK